MNRYILLSLLSWSLHLHTKQEKRAGYQETEVSASWTVTNNGTEPVSIVAMKIGCACASIDADQQVIPPTTTSTITAVFHIGDRVGLHRQQATVSIADGTWVKKQPQAEEEGNENIQEIVLPPPESIVAHTLSFSVDIEQPIKLSRKVLFWRKDSKAASKKVRVNINDPEEYSLLEYRRLP